MVDRSAGKIVKGRESGAFIGLLMIEVGCAGLLALEFYGGFLMLFLPCVLIGIGLLVQFPVIGAVFLLPLSQPIPVSLTPGSAGIPPEFLVIPFCFLLYLIRKIHREDLSLPAPGLLFAGVGFLTLSLVSLVFSAERVGVAEILPGIGTWYTMLLAGFVFVMMSDWINSKERVNQIFFALIFSTLIISLAGIFEYIVSLPVEGYYYRISSFFGLFLQPKSGGNPNALGAFLALTGVLGLSMRRVYTGFRRVIVYFSIGSGMVALIFTASRSSWIAYLCGALFLSLWNDRRILYLVIPTAVAALSYLLTLPRLGDRLFSVLNILWEPSVIRLFSRIDARMLDWGYIQTYGLGGLNIDIVAGALRVTSWIAGVRAFFDHIWLGVGLQMNIHYYGYRTAENLFLDIAIMTGVFGLCIFIYSLMKLVTRWKKVRRNAMGRNDVSIAAAIGASLVTLFVVSLTGSVLFHMKLLYVVSILFACLYKQSLWIGPTDSHVSSS